VDDDLAGKIFFGREVGPISSIRDVEYDCIVVTSYLKREKIYSALLRNKIGKNDVKVVFS
jgi:hypothetical protein